MYTSNQVRGLVLATVLMSCTAHAVMMTGSFTGAWFDESASGQGFLVQVVEVEGVPTAVVYWFTFDAAGNQLWLVGQAPVDGDSVSMSMLVVTGGILGDGAFDPDNVSLAEWGQLSLSFSGCDDGEAEFQALDPAIGSGSFDISRLTESLGDDCTGGISDNTPPGAGAINLRADLVPTDAEPRASGSVKFEQNANHTKLKVHVKKLPAGAYELLVDGEPVGEIETNNGGNGKLFFRSPQACNWELLDFEPRGATIEVVQGDTVFLSTVLAAGDLVDDPGAGEDDPGEDSSCDED